MDGIEHIRIWNDFFQTPQYNAQLIQTLRKGKKSIILNFSDVSEFNHELAEELLENPSETLKAGEIAINEIEETKEPITIRISNILSLEKKKISSIRKKHLSKFICVEGIIRQISGVRPKVTSSKFECPNCGNIIQVIQLGKTIKEPHRCGCGRKGRFKQLTKELIDMQRMVVEEPIDQLEGTKQPERLNIFLEKDLVDPHLTKINAPGARVLINGVLEDVPKHINKQGGESTDREIVLNANFIEPLEETFENIEITKSDIDKIIKLSKDPDLYDKLLRSYAPAIEGHSDIKEAIIIQAFGAVTKDVGGKRKLGCIHILLIGDPGGGKSVLLRYGTLINPKHRYSSGKGASGAGMTFAVIKDDFIGGWALEAGALVLAHKGIALLDEFDKMTPEDRTALHEGMSEGQFSVDKANIHATLRAETTILAAANPKFGRFEPSSSGGIAGQIELPSTLINRFDLIFPIMDVIDAKEDQKVINKIIQTHSAPESIQPKINPDLLKKYISYARKFIIPKFSLEAEKEIERFYLDIRNRKKGSTESKDVVPINPRQGETIIKLAEAHARMRLSKKIIKKDVVRAEKILMGCLEKIALDPLTGQIEIDRIAGTPKSKRDKFMFLLNLLDRLEKNYSDKIIPLDIFIKEAVDMEMEERDVEINLEKLKQRGELFEPKPGFIKKL